MKQCKRKKAFWGTLIAAGVSAIGGIVGSIVKAKQAEKQARADAEVQEKLFARQDELNRRAAANEYYNQINGSNVYDKLYEAASTAKMGGKFKRCKKRCKKIDGGDIYGDTSVIGDGLVKLGENTFSNPNPLLTSPNVGSLANSFGTGVINFMGNTIQNGIAQNSNDNIQKIRANTIKSRVHNYNYGDINMNNLFQTADDKLQENDGINNELQNEMLKRRRNIKKSLYLS